MARPCIPGERRRTASPCGASEAPAVSTAVNAILQKAEASREHEAGTLGGLLYADAARARISEADWVALVQAMARGETAALRALYERTHRLVFTLAFRLCGNRETAEEVTVDVFHELWRRVGSYDPAVGTVLAWVMNQTRSRAIDRLRREQRSKRTNPYPHEQAEPVPSAAAAAERIDAQRHLGQALEDLTADERLAIETAYFGEMSYADTAARLGQPVGTIKTRIRSGLAKLRLALLPERPA